MFSGQGGSSAYSGSETYGQVNVICLLHQNVKHAMVVLMCISYVYVFYVSVIFK